MLKLKDGGFLGKGNSKLGDSIVTWSIPAVSTCPGRSAVCTETMSNGKKRCYATQGLVGMQQHRYWTNYEASIKDSFVTNMTETLSRIAPRYTVVRLHVAGDFYSPEYVTKWLEIAAAPSSAALRFYVYTRSWRVAGFDKVLSKLSKQENVSLWYSTDKSMGYPSIIPEKVRIAYLAVDDEDANGIKPKATDLIFRDYPSRDTQLLSVGGRPVCPHENGKHGHVTCEKCQICIRPARTEKRTIEGGLKKRIPLTLVGSG